MGFDIKMTGPKNAYWINDGYDFRVGSLFFRDGTIQSTAATVGMDNVMIAARRLYANALAGTETFTPMVLATDGGSPASQALTQYHVAYSPCFLKKGDVIERLGIKVTTTDATAVSRVGLYANLITDYPGALLIATGDLAMNVATIVWEVLATPFTVPATGIYWGALQHDDGGSPTQHAWLTEACANGMFLGTNAAGATRYTWFRDTTLGAMGFPDPANGIGSMTLMSTDVPCGLMGFSAFGS